MTLLIQSLQSLLEICFVPTSPSSVSGKALLLQTKATKMQRLRIAVTKIRETFVFLDFESRGSFVSYIDWFQSLTAYTKNVKCRKSSRARRTVEVHQEGQDAPWSHC